MIQSIIIDDEKKSAESLQLLLEEFCPEVNLLAVCNSAKEGLEKINKLKPDLVFLDIEMPHMNGFELLECVDATNFKVIFTTAHDQYAIKAIKVHALDYLLKPIDENELKAAVSKMQTAKKGAPNDQLLKLLAQFIQEGKILNKLAVSTADGIIFLTYDEIIRLNSDSNYTWIYLTNGKKIIVAKTLGEYEEILPGGFFRIHKANIINLSHLKKYIRGDGGTVEMEDGSLLEVSRRRKNELMEKLKIK